MYSELSIYPFLLPFIIFAFALLPNFPNWVSYFRTKKVVSRRIGNGAVFCGLGS